MSVSPLSHQHILLYQDNFYLDPPYGFIIKLLKFKLVVTSQDSLKESNSIVVEGSIHI